MIQVIKATGEKEPFSEDKIRESIKRAGINQDLSDKVITHVKSKIYSDIPTKEVYKHVNEYLYKNHPQIKNKYSLKQAILDLGPTGYPFEDYVSEILKAKGYATQVRSVLMGNCVSHEVDVIAEKINIEKLMIEAKFHNTNAIRTDVHVALYTKARFEDLKEKYKFTNPWLFTNTKITSDALTYAQCVEMGVTSWSYPEGESLRDLIEKYKLYPITLLKSLPQNFIKGLLINRVVLVTEIYKNPNLLSLIGVPTNKQALVLEEATAICGN